MKSNMLATSALVALAGLSTMFASATARADILTNSLAYPAHPEYVTGGRPMQSFLGGTNYQVTALRTLTFSQPTSIDAIQGIVCATPGFNWTSNIQSIDINLFGATNPTLTLGAHPLVGEVYTTNQVSIVNLSGGSPPAWGGTSFGGWTNRYAEFGFSPFVVQPGDYLLSILFHINSGLVGFTETLNNFGIPTDKTAIAGSPGMVFDFRGTPGYTTGNAAVMVTGHVVPAPSSLALLMGAGWVIGVRTRRRLAKS